MFDSDGTLADTLPWARRLFNDLAGRHGFRKVSEQEALQLRDLHGPELLRTLGVPLWRLPVIVRDMRAAMAEHVHEFKPFPGVDEALRALAGSGRVLGVISSNSEENVRRILGPELAGLMTRFSCGVSMFGKARRIKAMVRAAGVAPREAIYVGDEVRDAEAAREAGVDFGAVGWGQHSPEALRAAGAVEVFASVDEMRRKLA